MIVCVFSSVLRQKDMGRNIRKLGVGTELEEGGLALLPAIVDSAAYLAY